jgi:excisionase family DNA binding protein
MPDAPPPGEQLMTTQEAAVALQCSPATILRLARAGTLQPVDPRSPVTKRPRRLRFRAADVAALAAQHQAPRPSHRVAEDPAPADPHA